MALRAQMANSSVNVEVDPVPQQDLSQVLSEIRAQYEGIVDKNRRDMEAWYKVKVRHGGQGHTAQWRDFTRFAVMLND